MRRTMMMLTVGVVLAAAGTAQAAVALVRGGAALASYEQVSDDGCVVTRGDVALLESSGGANPNGIYVSGTREDLCAGTGDGFLTFEPVDVTLLGLTFASGSATLVADLFSGNGSVVIEVDLAWFGSGAITRQHSVYTDGSLAFSSTAQRGAATFGLVTIDGDEADITYAALLREVSGFLSF